MIKVLKPGMQCSIQDQGRYGYRHLGMPVSGAMDDNSAARANLIVGNKGDEALLEIGPIGPELHFLSEALIALTGAPKKIFLNSKKVEFYQRLALQKGDVLSIRSGDRGMWSYIAVKGGIQAEKVWNSRSYYDLAKIGTPVASGALIPIGHKKLSTINSQYSQIKNDSYLERNVISVKKGPEYHLLSHSNRDSLFKTSFQIGVNSNRMGYHLIPENGLSLQNISGVITSAVAPGTIQLPPSGIPIALMKDCQTTGGYARILQICNSDLAAFAQKRPGSSIRLLLDCREKPN